jgi:hypothetical protein
MQISRPRGIIVGTARRHPSGDFAKFLYVDANRALGFWTPSVVLRRPMFDKRDD